MDIMTCEEIRTTFGHAIEKYCRIQNICVRRTANGAFYVENQAIQHNFEMILNENLPQTTDKKYVEILQNELSTPHETKNDLAQPAPTVKLLLKDSRDNPPTWYTSCISKGYILNTVSHGVQLVKIIVNMKIEHERRTYNFCYLPGLDKILEQLRINHKRMNYSMKLLQLLKRELKQQRSKHRYKIPRKILHKYFQLVFMDVVPFALFGNYKNRRKVVQIICAFLDTARSEFFDLGHYVHRLDLNCIGWLGLVTLHADRTIIISKVLKWLFVGFIIPLIHSQIHVVRDSESPYGRAFIQIDDWCRMKKKYRKAMERKRVIAPVKSDSTVTCPKGTFLLMAKTTSMRPIVKIDYTMDEKVEQRTILQFLHQLYLTCTDLVTNSSFHECWKEIVRDRKTNPAPIFLVSSDITNAFGSIKQRLLYNILQHLCEDIPSKLKLEWFSILSADRKRKSYRRYFTDLKFFVPPGVIFTHSESWTQTVDKRWLLEKIRRLIFQQQVQLDDRNYVINRGMAQGPIISPIFSNIYYNFLMKKKMSRFKRTGKLLRYADDLLFVTRNYKMARKFLDLVRKGVWEFNCYFQKSKTCTNLCSTQPEISYLGCSILSSNFEVRPSLRKVHERLVISFAMKPKDDIVAVYQRKLSNYSVLKLSRIVLDTTINSEKTLTRNLDIASRRFAKRAQMLTLYLFYKIIESHAPLIYNVIQAVIVGIANTISRNIFKNAPKMTRAEILKWYKIALNLFFTSLRKAFCSHNTLRKSFEELLNRDLSNQKRAVR